MENNCETMKNFSDSNNWKNIYMNSYSSEVMFLFYFLRKEVWGIVQRLNLDSLCEMDVWMMMMRMTFCRELSPDFKQCTLETIPDPSPWCDRITHNQLKNLVQYLTNKEVLNLIKLCSYFSNHLVVLNVLL